MFARHCAAAALASALALPALAAPEPEKESARTTAGLYVDAAEAHALMKNDPRAVLIDVRDPIEIMFTGWADGTDVHVPYRLSDRSKFNSEKAIYAMPLNPSFQAEVEARLARIGATKDDPLIFICRSGSTRSAPAADLFTKAGWTQAYTVVDGFEGGKVSDGPSAGVRARNVWRNSGLPWSYAIDPDIAYFAGE